MVGGSERARNVTAFIEREMAHLDVEGWLCEREADAWAELRHYESEAWKCRAKIEAIQRWREDEHTRERNRLCR